MLADLPDYKNGPYADIRKWVLAEMAATRGRARVLNRDTVAVRKEGAAQVALVGAPNAGKSSLLQALSSVQIRTGDYAFTTTRPVPALTRINGVLIQLVEIPGLIEGAHEDRGGGRALLGVARAADVLVACHDPAAPIDALHAVLSELEVAGLGRPSLLVATKADDAPRGALERLAAATRDIAMVAVSILDERSLEAFRGALWDLVGLLRVYLRQGDRVEEEPRAYRPPVLVVDVADSIHHDLGGSLSRGQGLGAVGPLRGPARRPPP